MSRMYKTLHTLYAYAHEHMSADELGELGTSLHEEAVSMGRDMSTMLQGVACLISSENTIREAGYDQGSGSLQSPEGIFQVLSLAASKFDLLAAMIEVGSDASDQANLMQKTTGGEA